MSKKRKGKKRRGLSGSIESHRTDAAEYALRARGYYRKAASEAKAGSCRDALSTYTTGASQHGAYKASKIHARPGISLELPMHSMQDKARMAIISCFYGVRRK